MKFITKAEKRRLDRSSKIHLPSGDKIPLSRFPKMKLEEESLQRAPPAWKVETVPNLFTQPTKANYYRHLYSRGLYRRACWQYMFGGILRSIFGIYVSSRYWDRDVERKLMETLRDDYLETKREMSYGLYNYRSERKLRLYGARWKGGPPETKAGLKTYYLGKGAEICCRINALDTHRPMVDFECRPKKFEENVVLRIPYKTYLALMRIQAIKPIEDKEIYALKRFRPTECGTKEANPEKYERGLRRLSRLREKYLSLPEKPEG